MRKQKIDRVISKWLEVLQGISHNEPLRVVTRNAQSFWPVPAPWCFWLLMMSPGSQVILWNRCIPLIWKPHFPNQTWDTLFRWNRQLGRFCLNPKICIPNYFMKNTGQNFLKVGTLQEILEFVGARLADWSLYLVSTFSIFLFSHMMINSERSGKELL